MQTMNTKAITWVALTIGAFLQGASMSLFLFPHNIPSGGAAGLAILIHHWSALPHGTALWVVNFVFLTAALKYFGYAWTIRTMYSVTVTSVTVSFMSAYVQLPHVNILLDLVVGGTIFGIGVGMLVRNGASSGGMVIPALMIANARNLAPGKPMFWINFFIFILTATVIDFTIVIYAISCQWLSTNIVNLVCYVDFRQIGIPATGWRKK